MSIIYLRTAHAIIDDYRHGLIDKIEARRQLKVAFIRWFGYHPRRSVIELNSRKGL